MKPDRIIMLMLANDDLANWIFSAIKMWLFLRRSNEVVSLAIRGEMDEYEANGELDGFHDWLNDDLSLVDLMKEVEKIVKVE